MRGRKVKRKPKKARPGVDPRRYYSSPTKPTLKQHIAWQKPAKISTLKEESTQELISRAEKFGRLKRVSRSRLRQMFGARAEKIDNFIAHEYTKTVGVLKRITPKITFDVPVSAPKMGDYARAEEPSKSMISEELGGVISKEERKVQPLRDIFARFPRIFRDSGYAPDTLLPRFLEFIGQKPSESKILEIMKAVEGQSGTDPETGKPLRRVGQPLVYPFKAGKLSFGRSMDLGDDLEWNDIPNQSYPIYESDVRAKIEQGKTHWQYYDSDNFYVVPMEMALLAVHVFGADGYWVMAHAMKPKTLLFAAKEFVEEGIPKYVIKFEGVHTRKRNSHSEKDEISTVVPLKESRGYWDELQHRKKDEHEGEVFFEGKWRPVEGMSREEAERYRRSFLDPGLV